MNLIIGSYSDVYIFLIGLVLCLWIAVYRYHGLQNFKLFWACIVFCTSPEADSGDVQNPGKKSWQRSLEISQLSSDTSACLMKGTVFAFWGLNFSLKFTQIRRTRLYFCVYFSLTKDKSFRKFETSFSTPIIMLFVCICNIISI